MSKGSVWVGGGEVNSHYLTEKEAINLVQEWIVDEGYTDVVMEESK